MEPLQKHKVLSIVTSSLLVTEFLCFLLVALSVPIIKSIYLLALTSQVQPGQPATSVATRLRFGVWGLCAHRRVEPVQQYVTRLAKIPSTHSAYGSEGWLDPDGFCYGPSVGYEIPDSVLQVTGYENLAQAVLKGLTGLLILHPFVAVLSFIGAATSLYLQSHGMHIISLVFTIVNAFLSSIVFAADLAINIIAIDKVPALTGADLEVEWGNGVWLVLVGVVLSWLGVILLSIPVCGCCGVRGAYRTWEEKGHKRDSLDSPQMTER